MNKVGSVKNKIVWHLPLSVYRIIFRKMPVGFYYHMVSDADVPHVKNLYPFKTPELFEIDLKYLKDNFNVITYEELINSLDGSAKLRPGSVMITFDDGYQECFSVVRPLLKKHILPCIFFITTNFVDNQHISFDNKLSLCVDKMLSYTKDDFPNALSDLKEFFEGNVWDKASLLSYFRSLHHFDENKIDTIAGMIGVNWEDYLSEYRPYLTTDEIKILADEGFTIGAHSQSHPVFTALDPEEIEREIVQSCQQIHHLTGQSKIPFAFPYGIAGLDSQNLSLIQENHAVVGPFFYAGGIRVREVGCIYRIPADKLLGADDSGSNLGYLLHKAYKDHLWSA